MKKIPTGSIYRKKIKGKDGAVQESKTLYLKYYVKGNPKPIRISAGTEDEEEALALLRKKMARAALHVEHTSDPDRVLIGQLLDLVIEDYQFNNRDSTYDSELRINKHLRPEFGLLKAAEFSTSRLKRYVMGRKKEGAEQATINKELAWLRRAFKLGFINEPKLVEVQPYISIPQVHNERSGVLSHEYYRSLRDLLPPYGRIWFVISYHTGARKGEIRKIRIDRIDLLNGRIELRPPTTKNKEGRYLPIYGDMRAELSMAIAAADKRCPFLIQDRGVPVFDFEKAWRTACKAVGIPKTLFHDLRRTALTNMIDAGFSEKEAMEISGHKTTSVFRRYVIKSKKRDKMLADKLEQHHQALDEALPKQEKPRYAN